MSFKSQPVRSSKRLALRGSVAIFQDSTSAEKKPGAPAPFSVELIPPYDLDPPLPLGLRPRAPREELPLPSPIEDRNYVFQGVSDRKFIEIPSASGGLRSNKQPTITNSSNITSSVFPQIKRISSQARAKPAVKPSILSPSEVRTGPSTKSKSSSTRQSFACYTNFFKSSTGAPAVSSVCMLRVGFVLSLTDFTLFKLDICILVSLLPNNTIADFLNKFHLKGFSDYFSFSLTPPCSLNAKKRSNLRIYMKNSPQSNSPLCQRPAALQKRRIRSFLLPRNHHPWILLSFRPLSLWQRALKLQLPLLHRTRQIPRPSPRDPFFPHLWFVLHRIFFFSSLFTFCECKLVLSLIMQSLSPSCMLEYRQPIFLALREAEVSGFLMAQIFSTHTYTLIYHVFTLPRNIFRYARLPCSQSPHGTGPSLLTG
jgi:hypothetical protein